MPKKARHGRSIVLTLNEKESLLLNVALSFTESAHRAHRLKTGKADRAEFEAEIAANVNLRRRLEAAHWRAIPLTAKLVRPS